MRVEALSKLKSDFHGVNSNPTLLTEVASSLCGLEFGARHNPTLHGTRLGVASDQSLLQHRRKGLLIHSGIPLAPVGVGSAGRSVVLTSSL